MPLAIWEVAPDGRSPERGGAPLGTPGQSGPQSQAIGLQLGLHAAIPPSSFGRPALLVRAARHYEGAGQILIRQAVMSAQHFVSTEPVELPGPGQWVVAECPARVDFSGEPLVAGGGEGTCPRARLAASVTNLTLATLP